MSSEFARCRKLYNGIMLSLGITPKCSCNLTVASTNRAAMNDHLKEKELESFLFRSFDNQKSGDKNKLSEDSQSETTDETSQRHEPYYFDYQQDKLSDDGTKEALSKEPLLLQKQSMQEELRQQSSQRSHDSVAAVTSSANDGLQRISAYEKHLREMYLTLHSNTEWAKRSDKKAKHKADEENPTKPLLNNASALLTQKRALPKGRIEITSIIDANCNDPRQSQLASMDYSSDGRLFMTATRNGHVSLFHIDGIDNPLIDFTTIRKFSIIKAAFLPNNETILAIGSPQYQSIQLLNLETQNVERLFSKDPTNLYHSFALPTVTEEKESDLIAFVNDKGIVPIYSLKSRQWVTNIQSNRAIEAALFVQDKLYTCSVGGRVNIWDMRRFRCIAEFVDQGTLHCTALKICPNGQYLSTGSDAGVVNIYKASDCFEQSLLTPPLPIKTIFNLKTEIDTIAFHPLSQVMAIASVHAPAAMKLVHLPSCNVFANWPNQRLSKSRVRCVAFSPTGDLMHVGSMTGRFSSDAVRVLLKQGCLAILDSSHPTTEFHTHLPLNNVVAMNLDPISRYRLQPHVQHV